MTKFQQIFLQNWDLKISGKNVQISLQEYLNPLSPNSDENEISLYIITTCSNIQVMRIKKVVANDNMSCCLDKFSLSVPSETHKDLKRVTLICRF